MTPFCHQTPINVPETVYTRH